MKLTPHPDGTIFTSGDELAATVLHTDTVHVVCVPREGALYIIEEMVSIRLVLYELLDLPPRAIISIEYSLRCIN